MAPPRLAALALVALLGAPACAGREPAAVPPAPPVSAQLVAAPDVAAPTPLCDALPDDLVADVTGQVAITADGAGDQCSWRTADAGGTAVLQGSFIDVRSFEAGRTHDATPAPAGLGDDAYVVHVPEASTTLYVRDGHRALALWLTQPTDRPADALAGLARRALAG